MAAYNHSNVAQHNISGTKVVPTEKLAYRNLLELVSFLLICVGAYQIKNFSLFDAASEPLRQILGCPPPVYLINIALAVYCFSSAVLTLTAVAGNSRPASRWNHLGYRCAFFVFYSFSGAIAANFVSVLCVGLFLYALDQFHIWFYCSNVDHQNGSPLEGKL